MVTASLSFRQSQAAPHVGIACAGAAQVDDRGQILLALERCEPDAVPLQCARHAAVEIGRRELHRMRGDDARVQTVEPAGLPVAPWAVLDDGMIADAIVPRFGEGAVGDLVHAHRARGGAVYLEWLEAE